MRNGELILKVIGTPDFKTKPLEVQKALIAPLFLEVLIDLRDLTHALLIHFGVYSK